VHIDVKETTTTTFAHYSGPTKRRMGAHWSAWARIEAHGRARRRMGAHWWSARSWL